MRKLACGENVTVISGYNSRFFFILFVRFSRQEHWSGFPIPTPVDHSLTERSTMTRPSWVALHGMAHSFVELNKAVIHVIILVWFLCVCVCCCGCCFSRGHGIVVLAFVCPLMDEDKRVVKAFCWEGLVVGKFESCFGEQGHAQ